MNVFEDLIDELKSENLLEETVIDLNQADAAVLANNEQAKGQRPGSDPVDAKGPGGEAGFHIDVPQIEKPSSDQEFFRKRAMEEVASLQMVEHVFSGVEREYLKVTPTPYDDLGAKKALHKFLQVSGDPRSPEHAEAEFALRSETEAWNFALYARDQKVSVENLRRFCEESRPVLSSQALIALARFYRNSPYSEDVRQKFDYVATRLFSREAEEETRQLLFQHDEMIGHINTLYANWSSIALYTSRDDQMEVSLTVTRFQEFTVEVENAESFDELLESNFFRRLAEYKEVSAEMFYVPEVLAAAIKCSLVIGNRYVELITALRADHSAEKIEAKYGDAHDQIVSNAAGKTLALADVLALDLDAYGGPDQSHPAPVSSSPKSREQAEDRESFDVFGVNRWLMALCVLLILAGGGVYIWAEKFAGGSGEAVVATTIAIQDPELKKLLREPRSTGETLFAVVEPPFEMLSEDEKKAALDKLLRFAETQNLQKVSLLSPKGRAVGYASRERLELVRD